MSEAQRDSCTLGGAAQSSVLMQRAKRGPPLPLGPGGDIHPDVGGDDSAHRWQDRLTAAASHAAGARRRRGTNRGDTNHAVEGFKVAKQQIEVVQDGLIAFKATDRDGVDFTMREMKDMQKVVVQIVAGLLFANMLAILCVCMCQVYAQNHKAPPEKEKEAVVLGPGARLGMIIEMLAARPGMLARLNGTEVVVPVQQAGETAPRPETLSLLTDAVTPCTPAPLPGPLATALVTPSQPPAPANGGSPRVNAAALKGSKSNKIVDPIRTVDAFCTPRSRPCASEAPRAG